MRCSMIILSFALTLLAAPVPQDQALAVDKRYLRKPDGQILNSRDVEDLEADLEARTLRYTKSGRREAEAETDLEARTLRYTKNGRREAEAEPTLRYDNGQKREAEAEPTLRYTKSGRRDAEAEPTLRYTKSGRREAEAEPSLRASPSQRGLQPNDRIPGAGSVKGGRSVVDISLRDIYNSARGINNAIIEALKGRGFNSANLLELM